METFASLRNPDTEIKKEGVEYTLYEDGNVASQLKIEEEDIKGLYFIWDVETEPKYRGKGYATRLMDKAMSDNKGEYYLAVKCSNKKAISLYSKLGFKKLLRLVDDKDGNKYFCMAIASKEMLNKIIEMYRNSFKEVEVLYKES